MIYLDHAAATPVSPKALAAMQPYFSEDFFNPSAPYLPAKHVREAYENAKDRLAHVIGAKGVDLVITAGATESINLAFTALGPAALTTNNSTELTSSVHSNPLMQPASPHSSASMPHSPSSRSTPPAAPRVLVLATEHAAVLEAAKQYPYELIKVDKYGLIDLADLRKKLTPSVEFISVSLANNELGTIQPLAEISEIVCQERQNRYRAGRRTPLYLHTDASQGLSLLDINVARLGVDLLTLNAAKCGGPKGVGALYISHGIKLRPAIVGGGQERGLRSGTENVPGLIGFTTAAEEAKKHLSYHRKQYQKMASVLRTGLAHISSLAQNSNIVKHKPDQNLPVARKSQDDFKIPDPIFLGHPKHQLASFIPVCFPGLDAERLIYKLESEGILVSTGAACAANKGTKSHVLAAIGLSDAEIAGSLRISLGSTNTEDQIREAATKIVEIVQHEYARLEEKSHV